MRKFNLFAPTFDCSSDRPGYGWRGADVGSAIGAEQMGARLFELEAGQRTYPYHFHHVMEEWLVVVAGTPLLRSPTGERSLRAGDVVCFPPGEKGAHQVTGPGTVLIVAENQVADAVQYPDSGKLKVVPSGEVFRLSDAIEYWDGE